MLGEARLSKRPQKPPAFILTPHGAERLRRRGRRLQRDLDDELARLLGRKRFGLVRLCLAVLAFSLIAVPFFWVMSLAKNGPKASPAMVAEAASSIRVSRSFVPVEEIDPTLVLAVVTAIDPAFCIDGSVFRRRLAQDVLLWPSAEGQEPSLLKRHLARYLAWHINLLWSQPRMVEVYMNSAVWGPGHIGVEAASLARYGLSSRALEARLQAVPLAVAVVEPDLMGEGAPAGALIERVDALAAETERLIATRAFACLTTQGSPTP